MSSSHTSPFRTEPNASFRLTFPSRIDLISEPVRTRPASHVSRMWYSCRALGLRATAGPEPASGEDRDTCSLQDPEGFPVGQAQGGRGSSVPAIVRVRGGSAGVVE